METQTPVATTGTDVPTAGARRSRMGPRLAKAAYMALLPLMLLAIIGLSVAPVAGIHEGWAYYRHRNIAFPGLLPAPITLRIWVGWLRSHNSVQDLLHQQNPSVVPQYTPNKDIRRAGEIVPAITVGFLLLSALLAFIHLLVWAFTLCTAKRASKRAGTAKPRVPFVSSTLWPIFYLIMGLTIIGLAIASFIILALGVSIYTRSQFGGRVYMAWPHWAWFLALGAGIFNLLLFPLTFGASKGARVAHKQALSSYKGPAGDADERKAAPFNASDPVANGNGLHMNGNGHHMNGNGHHANGNAWSAQDSHNHHGYAQENDTGYVNTYHNPAHEPMADKTADVV